MFRHLWKLFDYPELGPLMARYEDLRADNREAEAAALRARIAATLRAADGKAG